MRMRHLETRRVEILGKGGGQINSLLNIVKDYLAVISINKILFWIAILTLVIEAITALLRFGFGIQSTQSTAFIANYTFGIRIHHGYLGVILLLIALISTIPVYVRNILIILGSSMLLSDLIHHFIVLWLITGDPQFHLTYPRR